MGIVERPKRIFRREWFRRCNVEERPADAFILQCRSERALVDHCPASDIHNDSVGFHRSEFFCADHTVCLWRCRNGKDDPVKLAKLAAPLIWS